MKLKCGGPLLLLLLLCSCTSRKAQEFNPDLRSMLSGGQVESIELFSVTASANTRQMTPETVEVAYHLKLEIRKTAFSDEFLSALNHALAETHCHGASGGSEATTAIIFWGPSHQRVRSFYYGRYGRGGKIDNQACELDPQLYLWAQGQLPASLKLAANR